MHQLVTNKDIIIDDNTIFSYNEHLNMCKKIIDQSNLDINKILKESKKSKGVLPSADFIFLDIIIFLIVPYCPKYFLFALHLKT